MVIPNEPGGGRSVKRNEEKTKQLEKLVERDKETQVWRPQKKLVIQSPHGIGVGGEEGRWLEPRFTSPRISDQVRRK